MNTDPIDGFAPASQGPELFAGNSVLRGMASRQGA